ncbi:uncharacterized protein LOC127243175 [Andrographis paniculata]|uniref:uncharacterized protein LOC127243175 n=1 Tax=Andrographis paniculata TaxID=175694 RepID=UPI0021E7C495|nr:uncharacterized protein LOC127243175 [Andrographis paniculata]
MDQRGGCCIARYAGGAYDMSKVDRIMQRFRPIAPKPASGGGSVSGGGSCGSGAAEKCGVAVKSVGRGKKRRACRDSENLNSSVSKRNKSGSNTRRRKERSNSGGSVYGGGDESVRTLKLLPEMPEVNGGGKTVAAQRINRPLWLSFENGGKGGEIMESPAVARRVVLWSWVKVECVTDTWGVGCGAYWNLGRTDEERLRSLDGDTCPGLISDGLNRVRWMNAEYRRMVSVDGEGEVVAWVVMEDGVAVPPGKCVGFTCRVKVVTWANRKSIKTVPCDVWRMDCGGFAWRLDTTAALSLSL